MFGQFRKIRKAESESPRSVGKTERSTQAAPQNCPSLYTFCTDLIRKISDSHKKNYLYVLFIFISRYASIIGTNSSDGASENQELKQPVSNSRVVPNKLMQHSQRVSRPTLSGVLDTGGLPPHPRRHCIVAHVSESSLPRLVHVDPLCNTYTSASSPTSSNVTHMYGLLRRANTPRTL